MKRKNLVILSGPPGAGKSTWVREHLGDNDVRVSRDDIRFNLIGNDEDYFSHEVEVFDKFVNEIENNLNAGLRVFADATHINWPSRRKLLERIHDKESIDIDVLVFKTDVRTCLEHNEQRSGRAYVPRSVVRRMCAQVDDPAKDPYKYRKIITIDETG